MRIGILTQPLRYNYGGILQNYALQTVLKRLGHNPVTLDQTQIPSHSALYWIVVYCRRLLLRLFGKWPYPLFSEINTLRDNKKILVHTRSFIDKYINIKWETRYEKLQNKDYDALVVGSDQVWRPNGVRDIAIEFFSFANHWNNVKRVAYAASFATSEWEFSEQQTECCKTLAKKFDGISVREESGVKLCQEHLSVNSTWVLDPTLLLSSEDYVKGLNIVHNPAHNKSLFYYILDETDSKLDAVNNVANSLGLTPFRVNSKAENTSDPVEERIQPPVENWIQAFYDTDFVVTDSFHAVAFSIIFNKPFYVIINEGRGSARFESILSQFNLCNRIIKVDSLPTSHETIDWASVNTLLMIKRQESCVFLRNSLQ